MKHVKHTKSPLQVITLIPRFLVAVAMMFWSGVVNQTRYWVGKVMISSLVVKVTIILRVAQAAICSMVVKGAISIISTRPTVILTTLLLTATVKDSSLLMENLC